MVLAQLWTVLPESVFNDRHSEGLMQPDAASAAMVAAATRFPPVMWWSPGLFALVYHLVILV